MQINVCRQGTAYQNLKNHFAAILKFKNYTFVQTSDLLKQ